MTPVAGEEDRNSRLNCFVDADTDTDRKLLPNYFSVLYPDPPILAFFDFLAFFVFRFSLLFCAFFLSFPRIVGVPRREKKPCFFGGKKPLLFPKKQGLEGQGTDGRSETLSELLFRSALCCSACGVLQTRHRSVSSKRCFRRRCRR